MMYRFKLVALGAALALGTAVTANAQNTDKVRRGEGHQGEMRGRGFGGGPHQRLLKGIELTQQQKDQLRQLHEKRVAERKAKLEQERPKMQAERERSLNDIRSILTPDQRITFDANLADLKQNPPKMHDKRGGRGKGDNAAKGKKIKQ